MIYVISFEKQTNGNEFNIYIIKISSAIIHLKMTGVWV